MSVPRKVCWRSVGKGTELERYVSGAPKGELSRKRHVGRYAGRKAELERYVSGAPKSGCRYNHVRK